MFLFGISWNFHSDRFNFGVVIKRIFAKLTADSGFFESAKGRLSVKNVVAVNPHCTSTEIFSKVHRFFDVLKKKFRYLRSMKCDFLGSPKF